jgi:hypothetical protein
MIAPETTRIQKSRWNVSINAGVKVFDVIVGEIRSFKFADVEFEATDGIE